jgi:hypothetical protein
VGEDPLFVPLPKKFIVATDFSASFKTLERVHPRLKDGVSYTPRGQSSPLEAKLSPGSKLILLKTGLSVFNSISSPPQVKFFF